MLYNLPGSPRVVPHFIVHVVQPAGLPPGCTTFYSLCCATRWAPHGLYHIFIVYVVQPAGLPPGYTTFYSLDVCWATCRVPPGLNHFL